MEKSKNKAHITLSVGVAFGKVCEQKREKNARKTREKRNRLAFLTNAQCNIEQIFRVRLEFLIFLTFFSLAFWIPACWYPKRVEKRKNTREK